MPRAALVLAAVVSAGCGPPGVVAVNGQGSSFVEPVLKDWADEYLDVSRGRVRVNYQGTGSGAGVQQLTNRTADFGCSDAPMNREQLAKAEAAGGPVVHVPLVIGAVVPVYHLDGIDKPLVFSGPVLAEIYLGTVRQWNDPRLATLNPGVNLPALDIQPVYRSDSSGTTNIFTEYLTRVSPEFQSQVGRSTAPTWPRGVGTGQPKNDGVAGYVARTPGAIGYIELTYALDTGATFGAVVNRSGTAVRADLPGITAAAAAIDTGAKPAEEPYSLHDLTYPLTDTPGAAAYPICGMSYAILFRRQAGPTGRAVVDFLAWCTSDAGQAVAAQRNYAPLPPALRARVAEKLAAVEVGP